MRQLAQRHAVPSLCFLLVSACSESITTAPAEHAQRADSQKAVYTGPEADSVFLLALLKDDSDEARLARREFSSLRAPINMAGGIGETHTNVYQANVAAKIVSFGTTLFPTAYQNTTNATVTFFGMQGGSTVELHFANVGEFQEWGSPTHTGTPQWGVAANCIPACAWDGFMRTVTHTFPYSHGHECGYKVWGDQSVVAYFIGPGFYFGHDYDSKNLPERSGPSCPGAPGGGTGTGGGNGNTCIQEPAIVEIWNPSTGTWDVIYSGSVTVCE